MFGLFDTPTRDERKRAVITAAYSSFSVLVSATLLAKMLKDSCDTKEEAMQVVDATLQEIASTFEDAMEPRNKEEEEALQAFCKVLGSTDPRDERREDVNEAVQTIREHVKNKIERFFES